MIKLCSLISSLLRDFLRLASPGLQHLRITLKDHQLINSDGGSKEKEDDLGLAGKASVIKQKKPSLVAIVM